MSAAKFAKDILSKLLVSLLSAPIIWAVTLYYSKSISEMVSSFDPDWYKHYWYLVLIAMVLGVLQFVILWFGKRTARNVIISLLILISLLVVYSWKQLTEGGFPFNWPLLAFFVLYCILVAQAVSLSLFAMIRITINILAASEEPPKPP
jgi:hypothetical protein